MGANPDVIVIGAGVAGLVTAKSCIEAGLSTVVLEAGTEVGGVWAYREEGYGVMDFTHINVSKYNYCFSDLPFPKDAADFPHHKEMAEYIRNYVNHFELQSVIHFSCAVQTLKQVAGGWRVETTTQGALHSRFVAVCTGHHHTPVMPEFPGQALFKGSMMHSVDYKSAQKNDVIGKRLLVVGIGNSGVDIATQAASLAQKPVLLSTRSGAWVIPNYVFGHPVDLYACRLLLWLPRSVSSFIFETVVTLTSGSPFKWGLNPTMHAMQSQPTISPTLIHCIQRRLIVIKPNIERLSAHTVYFSDGTEATVDIIVFSTGYKVSMDFLDEPLRKAVLQGNGTLQLFKNLFCPDIGSDLAFIGFVQPASGGILSMAETQARWWVQLCLRNCPPLPSPAAMYASIKDDQAKVAKQWTSSPRHLLQQDPLLYNDDISARFGACPNVFKFLITNPNLGLRLIIGSCGAAQWRLVGPGKWDGAEKAVCDVPVTTFMKLCLVNFLITCVLIAYLGLHLISLLKLWL